MTPSDADEIAAWLAEAGQVDTDQGEAAEGLGAGAALSLASPRVAVK